MSKEAKPIAVVYIHDNALPDDGRFRFQDTLREDWADYYVIVVPVPSEIQQRVFELEVFYDKNFTEINYEDLKKWITDYLQPSPPTDNKP